MAELDRRHVLGLAAALAAQPLWGGRVFAAVQTAPPATGPLSADSVGALLKQHKVPGASLAVIEGAELVAAYGYGVAHGQDPVEPQTRFQAASISKTINALGVLRLVQAGRIGLDDPVNTRLKSWKLPDNALTERTPVTVRMLLSHTGGTNLHGFNGYARDARLPSVVDILAGRKPANSPAIRVVLPPGQQDRYSGGGTMVLQCLVMDVTGERYGVAMRKLVLDPLRMNESRFQQPPPADIVEQAAFGHANNGVRLARGFDLHPEQAAAGLWTTPRDLSKALIAIMRSHAGEAGSFLNQGIAQAMLTRVRGAAGLGTFINDNGVIYHSGVNAGFRALYAANPGRRRGRVTMTNGDNGDAVCKGLIQRANKAFA